MTPRGLARRWLTGGHPIRDYVPVSIAAGAVLHRATLTWPGGTLDVSDRQWTLGYAPVVVGIALPPPLAAELGQETGRVSLTVTTPAGSGCSELTLRPLREAPGGIVLFEAGEADIACLDPLRRAVLLRRLHEACVRRDRHFGEMTTLRYRQYAAQFFYPRRVVLVCTHGGRMFPIDLVGTVAGSGATALGIRATNGAVAELQGTRELVLCEVDAVHQPSIYALGKMGGQPAAEFVATGRRTAQFGIPVPDVAAGWREVRVTHDEALGVQRLFCGVVEREEGSAVAGLHHHHLLAWLEDRRSGGGYALLPHP